MYMSTILCIWTLFYVYGYCFMYMGTVLCIWVLFYVHGYFACMFCATCMQYPQRAGNVIIGFRSFMLINKEIDDPLDSVKRQERTFILGHKPGCTFPSVQ